jgi:hypothetical protein
MKPGDYVVYEDDMTIFGGTGHAVGSIAILTETNFRLDDRRMSKVFAGKWLAGNDKGKKFSAIYATRFKKIPRKEAKRIIAQYGRCQKCLKEGKLDNSCEHMVKRAVGECQSIIPDPPPEF